MINNRILLRIVLSSCVFFFALHSNAATSSRAAAFSNPLVKDINDILFIERSGSIRHMCDQYFGHAGSRGGGLFILKNWKSDSPQLVNVVKDLKVPSGTNQGVLLTSGKFLSPDLSYDGKTILFAWASGGTEEWQLKNRWNIFRMDIDGANLKRLTDGNYDDFDPCWLPNGRVVFISMRRGGYGRCHGRSVPTYTMFSMKADGSDMFCIDWHETNEWQPSVDNDGQIVYTRWDYIDRDSDIAHHFWYCYPDGTNPRSSHGNYPYPWCTMPEGSSFNLFKGDGRHVRPWIENNIRAIPNTSGKYVATAALHHGEAYGTLILIDTQKPDDYMCSQLTRLTPEVKFPEAETGTGSDCEIYGTAWPLSENLFFCNYKNTIVLYDATSHAREVIYTAATSGFRPIDPIPVVPRPVPPALATRTYQGERLTKDSPNATISVVKVNVSDVPLPENVKIKYMRMVQIFPKTTPINNDPQVHYGEQGICRMSLGTVPVEDDGSVYCKAPVGKEIYFQLLDEKGMAVQSMRSGTYVHPGEHLSCLGCHEDKWKSTPVSAQVKAMLREPSEITPEPPAEEPVNFYRTVKPVFDAKCAGCHKKEGKGPDMSYGSLRPYAFYLDAGGNGSINDPVIGGSRSIPGLLGARYSRLFKEGHLSPQHHSVDLTESEFRRITMWLDLGSYELGAYENVAAQRRGELVWPIIDVNPANAQGVENRVTTGIANIRKTLLLQSNVVMDGRLIKISLPNAGDYGVKLCGLDGKVFEHTHMRGPGNTALSLPHHARGIYVISIDDGSAKYAKKLLAGGIQVYKK